MRLQYRKKLMRIKSRGIRLNLAANYLIFHRYSFIKAGQEKLDILAHLSTVEHTYIKILGKKAMSSPRNSVYTAEAARRAGISKATLLRWLKDGKIPEVARDVRGWRVFNEEEVIRIREYANTITPPGPNEGRN
jgi:hypothetical protein